jgi:hypothetical protein
MSISAGYGTTGGTGAVITEDVAAITGRPPTTFAAFAESAADAWR